MERFFFERVGVCGNKGIAGAVGKRVFVISLFKLTDF